MLNLLGDVSSGAQKENRDRRGDEAVITATDLGGRQKAVGLCSYLDYTPGIPMAFDWNKLALTNK
jgi:hypothetical protein